VPSIVISHNVLPSEVRTQIYQNTIISLPTYCGSFWDNIYYSIMTRSAAAETLLENFINRASDINFEPDLADVRK
jgi:hypothetical protein